ncbi:MAG TPA: PQQ-dependent sugar dehydrogenase, partial [Gaiellaceae bacterium]|nr:PQQ-dependent sugar dehydrogenase [Gaiellaceae bacterium]
MKRAGAALAIALFGLIPGSACSSDDDATAEPASPCAAFAAAPAPAYEVEPFASVAGVRQIASATRAYGLDGRGSLHVLGPQASVAIELGEAARAVAVSPDGAALYALRGLGALELVRFESTDGGATFDAARVAVIAAITPAGARSDGGALAVEQSGVLWVATPDGTTSSADDPASRLGKVLRVAPGAEPTLFARGFRSPSALDLDPELGDVWVGDTGERGAEIDRVLEGKRYGWPQLDGLRNPR